MPMPSFVRSLVLIAWCLTPAASFCADEPNQQPPQAATPSIQQQLEELREGQRQLRNELEDIKKLLPTRPALTNDETKPLTPKISSVDVYGEPFDGTNVARIAIIEYSDFDCSFCAKYARTVFPRINQEYVKTGKIRYFFRDLPERDETNSWLKARAARCAGDQGKFWEMHDLLFAQQENPIQDPTPLAQTIGLDVEQFGKCFSTWKYVENIQRSAEGAKRMGIFGTPAFLIGPVTKDGDFVWVKKVLVGAQTYDTFKAVLDELLAPVPVDNPK
jgi:protein-disulfide isomerase